MFCGPIPEQEPGSLAASKGSEVLQTDELLAGKGGLDDMGGGEEESRNKRDEPTEKRRGTQREAEELAGLD